MPRFRHFQTTPSLTQDVNRVDIVGAILASCGPSLLSRSLVGQVGKQSKTASTFSAAFACFKIKFAQLARKNSVLENENVTLRQEISTMRNDVDFVQGELQVFRDRSVDLMDSERKHIAKADKSQQIIKSLETKVEQYGQFIRTLVDLKLDNPVKRAALSVMNGEDFEEALVNAVQAACQNKSSAWSRIVPAITGPRSPENYMSVLNLTLRARKDLRQQTKKSDFWKTKARMFPENADLVTPSSSVLSDLRDEAAQAKTIIKSPDPPPVLEDMLDTLRRGQSWPPRQEATDLSTPQSLQPLLLDSAEKDLISESSSILSDEIRNSLKLLPVRSEDVASPLGILKNGITAITTSGKCKDTPSPRIVRFAPHQENTIIMRPSSVYSNSSTLSYVSENASDCGPIADSKESQRHENTHQEDNESSGSESVLSDVYADFLNDTEVEDTLSVPAHISLDSDGSSECADTNEERSEIPLLDDTDYDSSGSEYSASEMCDDEDFAPQTPLDGHSTKNISKRSFTALPAINSTPSASDSSRICNGVKEKGSAEHRRLPSIEEEDVVSEEPRVVQPESEALSEVVCPDCSPHDDKKRSITAFSDDATISEPLKKRYGRVAISRVMPTTDDPLQSHESPTTLIPRSLSRNISPSIMAAADPLHIDEGIPEKLVTPLSSSIDVPVRRAADGRQFDTCKATLPQDGSAQSPTPETPPRSGLISLRSAIPKRPVLQQVSTNNVATSPLSGSETAVSDARPCSVKPSAKELGKRRGVILVEKPDISPALRDSPVVEHASSHSRDISASAKYPFSSLGRPAPNSRPHANDKENMPFQPTQEPRRVPKPIPAPITPNHLPRTHPRVPMMLSELEQSLKRMSAKAGSDMSRFDSNVAELLDSLSSSDLGSLEPSESDDPDSDCTSILRGVRNDVQEPRRDLADSPHVRKALRTISTGTKSKAVAAGTLRKAASTSSSTSAESVSRACLSPSRRVPASRPRTASKKHSSAPAVAPSDSASSSESSGRSSLSLDSPTVSRMSYRGSRFGYARASVWLDKLSPISSKMILPAERDIALSTLRHKQSKGGSAESKLSPLAPSVLSSSVRKPLTPLINRMGKARTAVESLSKGSTSPSKPSGLIKSPSPSPQMKVDRSKAIHPIPSPQPKPWPVLGVSGKVAPFQVKSKSIAAPAATSKPSTSLQQAIPNTLVPPSTLSNKPRSNTINTISPLPPRYHTPMSLTPDSPTKPRSNTVNSISPHARSPLSQNVVNAARDSQSRLNRPPPLPKPANECTPPSPGRSLSTKIAEATGVKSTAPLQIVKKGAAASKVREKRSLPPTAAFMRPRPALSPPTSTGRRISTSVAPLIPNWGSRNGGLSASQARSMLRSNNVSMR
ncbi:hypothetical protein D9619_001466 [Psilocybe cf. subviscida]|uniref:Uncharacterized protein n=1 Tax=Psilocybe cf. subviscida TaxID=2480587 RepID=A0A8H5BEF1_9AGAR|nr:hypothetical protein D9619_001466 [Psilocybe cf. subviscida]